MQVHGWYVVDEGRPRVYASYLVEAMRTMDLEMLVEAWEAAVEQAGF